MKAIVSVLLAALFPGLTLMGADDPGERIRTLDALHAAELGEAKKEVTAADDAYRAELKAYGQKVQSDGNLNGVLATNKALDALEKGQAVVPSTDPGVARIQKSYVAKRKAAAAAAAQAVERVNRAYVAKYKELVAGLTKANKVDDALKAQEKVDALLEKARQETASPGGDGGELDAGYWRKKALAEYPDLANPNSPLAQKVKARTRELRSSKPSYFSDAKWPYLVTRECSEALKAAVAKAEKPSGKVSPCQGIFKAEDGNSHYFLVVDEAGAVSGLHYQVTSRSLSLITGKRVGGRLRTTWTHEHTKSDHRMEFEMQKDGTMVMSGEFMEGTNPKFYMCRMTRVGEAEKYRHLLEDVGKLSNSDGKKEVVETLGKFVPEDTGKKKSGGDGEG